MCLNSQTTSNSSKSRMTQLSPEQILEDAVYVAAPWMSREEAREFVNKPKEKEVTKLESKIKLRQARDANLMKMAIEVRDRFGSREQKRRNTIMNCPEIESLRTYYQGNYTVVVLNGEFVGVSKKMKKDKTNHNTGLNKALYRAVRRLVLSSQG